MIIVTTEHGTKFRIDPEHKTWERIDKTGDSGNLRDESGTFIWSFGPTIGEPLVLVCPPRVEGASARAITTSIVEKIDEF
jgi:hypothetical protein